MAAVSFLLVHNHLSGDPRLTSDDEETPQSLRHLSHVLNIPLQLHIIIAPRGRCSIVLE